jgi:hypothetical protein
MPASVIRRTLWNLLLISSMVFLRPTKYGSLLYDTKKSAVDFPGWAIFETLKLARSHRSKLKIQNKRIYNNRTAFLIFINKIPFV